VVRVRAFARDLADRRGVAVHFAIHAPHRNGDGRNTHAHVLTTTRTIEAGGVGREERDRVVGHQPPQGGVRTCQRRDHRDPSALEDANERAPAGAGFRGADRSSFARGARDRARADLALRTRGIGNGAARDRDRRRQADRLGVRGLRPGAAPALDLEAIKAQGQAALKQYGEEKQREEATRQQQAQEQARRERVISEFSELARGRARKGLGYGDRSEKWLATPEPLRAQVDLFNQMPEAARERSLIRMVQEPAMVKNLEQALGERRERIQALDRGLIS